MTGRWIGSITNQSEAIKDHRDIITEITTLKSNFLLSDGVQHVFLITQKKSHLEPFERAVAEARSNLVKIRRYNHDRLFEAKMYGEAGSVEATGLERERNLIEKISGSLEAKVAAMKMTLAVSKNEKNSDAMDIVRQEQGIHESEAFIKAWQELHESYRKTLAQMYLKRDESIEFNRIIILLGALLSFLMTVLVVGQLIRQINSTHTLQKALNEENSGYQTRLDQQTREIRLLAMNYQEDVERERQKLSREIHDELGSVLTATKMDLAWISKKTQTAMPEIYQKLEKTMEYINRGITFKRQIVQDLHPSVISTFGFWPALRSLAEDFAEKNQWELTLEIPDENIPVNDTIALIAYRIIQEALNNATKYAAATRVGVYLMTDEKYLKIEVQDNGKGMDTASHGAASHGISGMRHRVLAIGGRLEITSTPGKGVHIDALLLLDIVQNNPSPATTTV